MNRVRTYARQIGAQHINDFIPESKWTLERNREWILQMMHEGRKIIDIGPHFQRRWLYLMGDMERGRGPSEAYAMERRLLRGYRNYEKVFMREGPFGGVPGLSIPGWSPEPFFPRR